MKTKEKKEKKIEAGAAQEESALPSFKKLLVDTTQVYMNEDKKKKNKDQQAGPSSDAQPAKRKKTEPVKPSGDLGSIAPQILNPAGDDLDTFHDAEE